MLLELLHDGVRDGHVFEHALQLRRELAATLSLKENANIIIVYSFLRLKTSFLSNTHVQGADV